MAMNFPVGGSSGDFKRIPGGTHIAVCNMVADLGVQPGSAMYPDPKRQVVIRWEVPGERTEYEKDGEKMEGPLTISRTFTASMNEKSGLRKLLEAWRGKKFSDAEAAAFDVSTILGKACILNVSETEKGGETYANVASASPLMKGMAAPEAENPLLYFADDDRSQFDALPKWVREKIDGQIKANGSRKAESLPEGPTDFDDEIGF